MAGRRTMWAGLCVALCAPAAAVAHVTHLDPLPPTLPRSAAPAPPAQGLASTWCGPQASADDVANETGARSLPKIKVVEAHTSDHDLKPGYRGTIQDIVRRMVDHVAAESGGRRSIRFDLGTSCGAEYVDILTIRLPRPWSHYLEACRRNDVGDLFDDTRALLPNYEHTRTTLVFLPEGQCNFIAGVADASIDDSPGPGNDSNEGDLLGFDFTSTMRVALHETGHTLGAVQLTAPHTDGGFHCWDKADIMCYDYTSNLQGTALHPCPRVDPEPFDCGKDDYFNPSPPPGSYLASHWNLFNSVFMCEVGTCVPKASPKATPTPAPTPVPTMTATPTATPTASAEATTTPTPSPSPSSRQADSAPSADPSPAAQDPQGDPTPAPRDVTLATPPRVVEPPNRGKRARDSCARHKKRSRAYKRCRARLRKR